MAGTPKKRAMLLSIDKHDAEIRALVEGGKTLREIESATGFPHQRIHEWLTHASRADWYKSCRRAKATMSAETMLEIMERATRESIAVDRERSKAHQWTAERLDPDNWGNRPLVAVQLNHITTFVDSLRKSNNVKERAARTLEDAE